ncbi:Integral membrane protein OS=Tsukamurella paurometabola (strain ATCC 8368 / DSM / CCUG 35730/ CIP 100753 / JCM 10117 / KCTC 9821 / NBRC 16120 / NCIMB 702349/ NCTC 13040) OX=521096 GN=Tpau_2038 PE=4 SV=1 [Tsukamurella paurometabola]|uniref:Uncharacterized protein n=1 Tax=Tsukamurella paurometabola (strain ATCC 8368 / DSM 20162 / CCUG 35730 / CIP 100753 / JCM 10117 / KCTC 9821 / NBRC 16120 / NCIMB 702349 / NCTC 13040) TaxID=521096 RepID=D5UNT2_TSUPD|nr:hypothetical protein [Tsukamurella paurometabola]ADG78650.1 hypothetical protein Tpau_2038 [Tsukamurella paurometabola DSM 20162]SUP32572.1 Uncharacterised protein [Tsukamurella paurometabola]
MTGKRELSIGRLALFSMGAAVVVLGLVTLLLTVLRPSPWVGLLIVSAGLVAAVGAMGFVSTRMVRRATDGDGKSHDDTD